MSLHEIMRQDWVGLLDRFSEEFAGQRARLEVVGRSGAQHIVAESLPFDGMNIDLKDGENVVSIILAQDGSDSMLNHTVSDVRRIMIDELNGRVARVELSAGDGTTTVFTVH